MHCKKGFLLASPSDSVKAYIFWDLGGDLTQLGNPQAIPGLVEIQGKVITSVSGQSNCITTYPSPGTTHRRNHMGNRSLLRPCFNPNALPPNILFHAMVPHGNLRDPCSQRSILLTVVLAALLLCRPLSTFWTDHVPNGPHHGVCGDQRSLDLYIGIFNLLLDVTVVILPMPVLWGLHLPRSKKFVLSGIFGLGLMYEVPSFILSQPLHTQPQAILTQPQNLHRNSNPHNHHLRKRRHKLPSNLQPRRPPDLSRSSARHNQRLSPRHETRFCQIGIFQGC